MRARLVLALAFAAAIFATAIIYVAGPVSAAPPAQNTLPDFTLDTQTTITVTVAITGGQVIVVPVDLTFIAQNENGTPDISIVAQAEQQAGIFIGVARANSTNASLRLGLADAIAEATPTAPATATDAPGTHVVNTNANLRAGPGTDFEIIGKPRAGDIVTVVGQNDDGSWMQLDNGGWIAEFLVDPVAPDTAVDDNGEADEDEEATTESAPTDEQPAGAGDQPELTAYLLQVSDLGADVTSSVIAVQALIQNPQPSNDAWRNDISAELAVVSSAIDQYLGLSPVAGYEELHAQVTDVAVICDQAVRYIAGGLEDPQAISATLANDLVQSCIIQANNLAAYIQTIE